ncbi:MAG TPA: hypothetical protein VJX74_10125 [Blastocatellia bacterium]|nr:hypothetical protein [Blastocatellia bacterium]
MKNARKVLLLLIIAVLAENMVAASQAGDSARKVDEYGDIAFESEKPRLDNFAIELKSDPNAVGYLIVYAGRRAVKGIAKTRALRAKNYLVKKRRLPSNRIVWVDGGYREDLSTEMHIAPRGATAPSASPSVDPSEVQFVKATKAKKGKPKAASKARKPKR